MAADNPFTAELVLQPVPSRLLLMFIVSLHLAALLLLGLLSGLNGWLRLLLFAAIAAGLIFNFLLFSGRLLKRRVSMLYWRESGGWELTTAAGEHLPVIFCNSSFSSSFIDVLNFKTRPALGKRRFTVILLPDNSDAQQRRYLRMRLGVWQALHNQ